MPLRTVQSGSWTYTISLDDPALSSDRIQALVRARLVDELTGEALASQPVVRPFGNDLTGTRVARALVPRTAAGGIVGLAGIPRATFPALDVQSYAVGLAVTASGFIPYRALGVLPMQLGFPATFIPADLGDLQLRRMPVVISGHVMRRVGSALIPAPNVRVELTRFWPRLPDAAGAAPPPFLNALALPRGLYRERPAGLTSIRRRDLALANLKRLRSEAAPGDTTIELTDRVGVAAGSVVVIDGGDADRVEYIPVIDVRGASTPQQPATADLRFPLACAHDIDAAVQVATPVAAGWVANSLAADGLAGDPTVFLASQTDLAAATTVEVFGGGNPMEYQPVARYDVVSGVPDGYFRLPPLGRSAQVRIVTTPPLPAPGWLNVSPDYTGSEFRADLVVA